MAVKGNMPEPASAHEPYYNLAQPPQSEDLRVIEDASKRCQACHLWQCGTQTVFGDGPSQARIMMVGEQPGDKEDLAGKPFVGPAGQLLDRALEEAGVNRSEVYVTNAVKHFKWEPGPGGRRLHEKPNRKEVAACRPWLDAELAVVQPECVLLLGATAAQAVLGPAFRLTQHRGEFVPTTLAPLVMATLHPSAVLRMPDEETRAQAYGSLVADLRMVREALATPRPSASLF